MTTQDTQALSPPRVAIIGAGVGGLTLAIKLKQQLGYDNFTIFEKGHDVGGTWRDHTYPGCSSDVPMVTYSLSTEKHDWTHSHGYSPSILAYWQELATKYDLYPSIQFNTIVTSATWDDATKVYQIALENVKTGDVSVFEAEVLVSAIGLLEVPRFSQIQGRESFKGEMWHSARWPNDGEERLRGKRVAVIGNGASATQFVPCITEDPTVRVTEFCRTPNWFLPPIRIEYSATRRWIFKYVPLVQWFWRCVMYWRQELFYLMIFGSSTLHRLSTKMTTYYIRSAAPKELHDELIPKYPLGCKRVIFDTDFLKALHRPNLDLNWDGVGQIVEDGILTQKGEKIPFDVIIFATGYVTDQFPLKVRGIQGSLQDYFAEKNGPQAYRGTAFPGFPNFFTIFGPGAGSGHTSVVFTNETQSNYIIQLIKPILTRNVATVEVKSEPTEEYNEEIQKRLAKTVFMSCQSWYRVGGSGKISNIFPGSTTVFWMSLRKPKWADYTGLGLEAWLRRRRRARVFKWTVAMILVFGVVGTAGAVLRRDGVLATLKETWKRLISA